MQNNRNTENISAQELSKEVPGIYFGTEEICVSFCREGKVQTRFRMPACVTVTEVGEILAGSRAVRYRNCHKKAPLYSVLEVMRQGKWKKSARIRYKGIELHALRMCDCLMRELRRELDRLPFGGFRECVVAVPSFSCLFREYLEGIMGRAGFVVRRILAASTACGFYVEFLQDPDKQRSIIICAVSNDILDVTFLELEVGVAEILYKLESPLPGGGGLQAGNVGAFARQTIIDYIRKENADSGQQNSENEYREIRTADCYLFAEGGSVVPGNDVGRLCDIASAGAAVQGAKLAGNREAGAHLLLDTVPVSYGLEILRASDGQTLQELQWEIMENTTLPVKKYGILFDRRKSGNDVDIRLKLQAGFTYRNDFSETVELTLENFYSFIRSADQIEFGLSLDVCGRPEVLMCDRKTGKEQSFPVILYTTRVPLPTENRQIDPDQVLKAVWQEMSRFVGALSQLTPSEKNSPTGQGLGQVEKQCQRFLDKWGKLQKESTDSGRIAECIDNILLDVLQITDSLEYGLRGGFGDHIKREEALMFRTYLEFLDLLERYADVRPVEAEGCIFDANIHAAILHEEADGMDSQAVTAEMQRGYFRGSRLLRPATVKVAN